MSAPISNAVRILVSSLIAAVVCVYVARRTRESGVERFGSRILLISALIDTVLMTLVLLLLGLMSLSRLLRSGEFHSAAYAIALLLLVLPARSIWNYATATRRMIQQLGLRPCCISDHQTEIATLAEAMGTAVPLVFETESLRTPVVFGTTSRNAHLAIPCDWNATEASNRHVMLCHELAHIRNRDVGFLTWSFALLRDLKWTLTLAPGVVILSLFVTRTFLLQSLALYSACLGILWTLTNIVVRRRELLADQTVTMLIKSGQITQAVDDASLVRLTAPYSSEVASARTVARIQSWLADKTLFSTRPMIWKAVLRLVETVALSWPSVRTRVQAVRKRGSANADTSIGRSEAFWAGVTLGLLGVLIALTGFWVGKFLLGWQDDEQTELLCYDCLASVGPMAIGLVALFFVLPGWSSIRSDMPISRGLFCLARRYVYGFLGACCVSPLILLGGWSHIEIKVLFVLNIAWVCCVLGLAASVNLVMLFLWMPLRHRQRHFFIDLRWALYSYGLGILGVFLYLALGLVCILNGKGLAGGSILLGLFIGLSVFTLAVKGAISGTEQYMVTNLGPLPICLEGQAYRRWSPVVGFLQIVLFLILATAISTSTLALGRLLVGEVGDLTAIAIVIVFACMLLPIIERRTPKRVGGVRVRKAGALIEMLAALEVSISIETAELIGKLATGLRDRQSGRGGTDFTTSETLFHLTRLAPLDRQLGDRLSERINQWATTCEADGGFSLWPRSTPRLSSTYQCLRMLWRTDKVMTRDARSHISWIRGCLKPDGAFVGPWSKRPKWENTFFAVASLDMLGADLPEEERARCFHWTRNTLVIEGVKKGQLDALHYCLATLQTLQELDEETVTTVASHLSVEMDRLLLTNIAHDAENVHHAVQACHILKTHDVPLPSPEQTDLLAERINAALEAELAALRI